MTAQGPRSSALVLSFCLCFGTSIAAAQTAGGEQTPPATPPQTAQPAANQPAAAQPAQPSRPGPTPLQQWINDTRKIDDPAKRLETLRSIHNASATVLRSSGIDILSLLISRFPDRTKEIETAFRQVLDDIPSNATAQTRLSMTVSAANLLLDGKVLLDKAESAVAQAYEKFDPANYAETMRKQAAEFKRPAPDEKQLATMMNSQKARALETLGRLHVALGDTARGEKELKEVLTLTPASSAAATALAEIAAKRGDKAAALDYYFTAALSGRIKPADEKTMQDLFRDLHGSDAGFEDAWDRIYREKLPSPVTVEKYARGAGRTNRAALVEMFTGSGCPPCAAADVALDAVMARYRPEDVIAIAYHVHIPQPDPMTTPGSMARKEYYKVPGVPTAHIDGGGEPADAGRGYVKVGGGDRAAAVTIYPQYVKAIDKELQIAPRAALAVRASLDGQRVNVSAKISNVAPGTKDLTLHVVLAEHELRFSGENGIRFHPMVVRGVAGDDKPGLPVVLDSGKAAISHTFDLAAIRGQISKSLADEIARRREQAKDAAVKPTYRAEGRAYTDIDTSALSVVAFLQDGNQNVLQAAKVDIAPTRTRR